MSLFAWLWDTLFGAPAKPSQPQARNHARQPAAARPAPGGSDTQDAPSAPPTPGIPQRRTVRLARLRFVRKSRRRPTIRDLAENVSEKPPYAFARPCVFGGYFDLASDGQPDRLAANGLPPLVTPTDLATWLGLAPARLAWLIHRFSDLQVPAVHQAAHYHYRWIAKRSGGERLIEAPKPLLKAVQEKILREILDKVPPHAAAHGFRAGRSIVTNAHPHVGQRVLVKVDLQNFYPSVSYSRVVAIFRSLGFSREVSTWLARLTTTKLPLDFVRQSRKQKKWSPYLSRHLPQGAPTSPALANLSAFALDLRLAGLARTFSARYTRYADDLSFSGDGSLVRGLRVFLPLVHRIIRNCRFVPHPDKGKILRSQMRQVVTGVVVNARTNIRRADFDRLKALLHNCVQLGPASQNRAAHPHFAYHLLGRIAHVRALNPARGEKLLALYRQINWAR
jgi:RNA-directed DNA polymerase